MVRPSADWNLVQRDMSAANDFPPTKCTFRYLICSTPRSGSWLLCSGLTATGAAGRPAEYLSGPFTEAYKLRFGLSAITLNQYWQFLLRHRTSPNGVFGLKMHFDHVLAHFKDEAVRRNMPCAFDRLIFLTRRDKLGQAISFWKANTTGIYRQPADGDRPRPREAPYYNFEEIARRLADIANQEASWRAILASVPDRVVSLTYEDLSERYPESMRQVLTALGLESAIDTLDPAPNLAPQRDELDQEWRRRFLEDTGQGRQVA